MYFTVLIRPQFLRMMGVASKGSGGQQEFKMGKTAASLYANENGPVEAKHTGE